MRFIHFGCWNNIHGDLEENMEAIQRYIKNGSKKNNKVDFFSIAGDNYYPNKSNSKGEKIKTIVEDELREGFELIPNDGRDKFLILGNHDLETNMRLLSSSGRESHDNSCKILELERDIVNSRPDTTLDLFKFNFDSDTNTLLIFFDTTMYVKKDFNKFKKCYKSFVSIDNSRITRGSPNYQNDLNEYQRRKINEEISKYEVIDKIVFIGHHPLIYLKNKDDEIKAKSDIPRISDLLSDVHDLLPNSQYYYLCADLHLYQQGEVTFYHDDKEMKIKQYIVGTGGTHLDLEIPTEYNNTEYTIGDFHYAHNKSLYEHGFLVCDFNEKNKDPIFEFQAKRSFTPKRKMKRSRSRSISPTTKKVATIKSKKSKGGKYNYTKKKKN